MQQQPPPVVRILPGIRGADKLLWSDALSTPTPTPATPASLVLFFGGDRLDDPTAHPDVHRLQSPAEVARLLRARFGPGATLVQVVPSRHEAGFACFDHFLGPATLSGEPLGYGARVPEGGDGDPGAIAAGLPALAQLASLLAAPAGGWPPPGGHPPTQRWAGGSPPWPPTHLVAFSKGGAVLNQALAELAALAAAAGGGRAAPAAWSRQATTALASRVASLAASARSLLYVDVGLNGRGAYACPPEVGCLGGRSPPDGPPSVVLYGTRRQWPPGGPQAAERDRMVSGLRGGGLVVEVVACGAAEPKVSLAMHFRCLEEALLGGGSGGGDVKKGGRGGRGDDPHSRRGAPAGHGRPRLGGYRSSPPPPPPPETTNEQNKTKNAA
jgi:hypothetical protein